MSNEYEAQLRQYDATIRRQDMQWQARIDRILQSDRASIEIGIGALKTMVLINAGALVALMAFVGQLWNKDGGRLFVMMVIYNSYFFVVGLIAGFLLLIFINCRLQEQQCIVFLRYREKLKYQLCQKAR